MKDEFTKKEAVAYLNIPENYFNNYVDASKEIVGYQKPNRRWYFKKEDLDKWNNLKKDRTIILSLEEYEKCFEFAIKMVYGGLSLNGIRGQRTEVQGADDVILGILAEYAVKKFLAKKFDTHIQLDEAVHTSEITPQDFHKIKDGDEYRTPKLGVSVKASKMKNAYLVLGANEVEFENRKSDVHVFARVGLPSDHLFRILREHSFFAKVKKFLEESDGFKKINKLENVPVWICGFTYDKELEKVKEIPKQKFDGYRYVKSVKNMHNSDEDWKSFVKKL